MSYAQFAQPDKGFDERVVDVIVPEQFQQVGLLVEGCFERGWIFAGLTRRIQDSNLVDPVCFEHKQVFARELGSGFQQQVAARGAHARGKYGAWLDFINILICHVSPLLPLIAPYPLYFFNFFDFTLSRSSSKRCNLRQQPDFVLRFY